MAHKGARNDLTADEIRNILNYDPETGVLTWKESLSRRAIVGKPAGWRLNGYICVGIYNRDYYAHRLIWLMMSGEWPPEEIDHRDGDRSNNRWSNLRLASSSQNLVNQRLRHGNRRGNTSGFKGVSFHKQSGHYIAYIQYQKKHEYLGSFDTVEEAYAARQARARELFGEFDREAHVKA